MKSVHYIQMVLGALAAACPAVAAAVPVTAPVCGILASLAITCLTVLGVVSPAAGAVAAKPPVAP